jgi:hypothetical protein
MQSGPVRERRACVHVVPKLVPQRGAFVAVVVPHNPKVGSDNHAERSVRVVASRLLPSRVVLYHASTVREASTMNAAEIASGR